MTCSVDVKAADADTSSRAALLSEWDCLQRSEA
jgi:hypothetical protein